MSLPMLKLRALNSLAGAIIELDGRQIPGVRSLHLTLGVGKLNEVVLRIGLTDVDVDAETLVALEAYVKEPAEHV